jgi:hypothetical protein
MENSNNETNPNVLYSEEMPREKFGTKEMCATSEMPHATTQSHISSTSNASNTRNEQNEWKHTEYFCIKRQEKKQSFSDSYASIASSSNGRAHDARPKIHTKVRVTAAGTSVSEDLTNLALASEGSEGKLKQRV